MGTRIFDMTCRILLLFATLVGCGIKGDPLPVEPTVSGRAEIGITTTIGG
ncbi:MAG: hypothetical protein AAF848_01680 [Pseudomonadota bacterium]